MQKGLMNFTNQLLRKFYTQRHHKYLKLLLAMLGIAVIIITVLQRVIMKVQVKIQKTNQVLHAYITSK